MAPRAPLLHLLPLALISCNTTGFGAISFSPIYSYVEGCVPVVVRGSGFGGDVKVTFGATPLEQVALPDPATEPLNVGYDVYGIVPAAVGPGYAPVTVSSGGHSATIKSEFYYVACPGAGQVDAVYPYDGVKAGDTVTLYGCNLDPALHRVSVGYSDPVPVTSTCRSAEASFVAPTMPDGTFTIHVVDNDGNILFPTTGCGSDLGLAVQNLPHPGALVPPRDTAPDTGGSYCANPSISYGE